MENGFSPALRLSTLLSGSAMSQTNCLSLVRLRVALRVCPPSSLRLASPRLCSRYGDNRATINTAESGRSTGCLVEDAPFGLAVARASDGFDGADDDVYSRFLINDRLDRV